jgi:hypothetical protein
MQFVLIQFSSLKEYAEEMSRIRCWIIDRFWPSDILVVYVHWLNKLLNSADYVGSILVLFPL